MNVLVVYCHPCQDSFNAAILKVTLDTLAKLGHATRLVDLYREEFDPVMRAEEWHSYGNKTQNLKPIQREAEHLLWAEAVVFVYPTWWYGLPAMLKGWLEKILVPGFAFEMPTNRHGPIPKLKHIKRLIVLTTCGATPLVSWIMGQPGRRTLLRGFRSLCDPFCRTKYVALYRMDSVPEAKRKAHLVRVRKIVGGLGSARAIGARAGQNGLSSTARSGNG